MSLDWLYGPVAWVIIQIHAGLSQVFDPDSGLAWGLSIVALTVFMRILLFPLFVKQINSSRKMQELQPQIMELRKKYKNDKQRLSQETMKLYQEAGANPLMGCLPLLLQMPIFFALFRVLQTIAQDQPKFGFTSELVHSASHAKIFGVPIAARFLSSEAELAQFSADPTSAKIVALIAVIISSITTFLSVRQSVGRSLKQMPDSPMAQQQKFMIYLAPAFGLVGLGLPVGVLVYWVTNNTWTLAQQQYIFRRYPIKIPNGGNGGSAGKSPAKSGGGSGGSGAKPGQKAAANGAGGTNQSGTNQSGTNQSGTNQSGTKQSGTKQPATKSKAASSPTVGTNKTGTSKTGTKKAAAQKSGAEEAGTDAAGAEQESGTQQGKAKPATKGAAAGAGTSKAATKTQGKSDGAGAASSKPGKSEKPGKWPGRRKKPEPEPEPEPTMIRHQPVKQSRSKRRR